MIGRIDIKQTPDGRRLVVSRDIAAPVDRVWDVFVDTRRWPDWGPSVTAVECSDRRISAGTRGRVRTPVGLWLPFTVTTCANYRWTWRIGPFPATGHRVEPAGRASRASFEIPILTAPYALVCWRALGAIDRLVAGPDPPPSPS